MEENTALHLVDQLRDRGIDAHLYQSPTGARGYGIRIGLRDGLSDRIGEARGFEQESWAATRAPQGRRPRLL
ncbi:MAG TPA: hypothetical protein VGJ14_14115 [Sporichthyaceae bacterium]